MQDIGAIIDEYFWGQAEQGVEPIASKQCLNCYDDLYEGQEVLVDKSGNYFCDYRCAYSHYEIEEAELTTNDSDKGACEHCGELLNRDYEVYKNTFSQYFCSNDCAGLEEGLKHTTIEKVEE